MSMHHDQRARDDAERTRVRAFWTAVLRGLRGQPNELVPFGIVRELRPRAEAYSGVRSIPLEAVVGSVDRYRDFDHFFLPRLGVPLERWIGVRRAGLDGINLPAIEVYQVGGIYFVKDGHHRVSVARNAGQRFIDAAVVELSVPIEVAPGDTLRTLVLKGEAARFLEATGLERLRPEVRTLRLSVPGRCDVLLEHIATHRYFMGQRRRAEVAWSDAVASWYDTVYLPVARAVAESRILERFPGRTEADVYLWTMDHLYFLRQRHGQAIDPRHAAVDFARRFAPPRWRRWWRRLRSEGPRSTRP